MIEENKNTIDVTVRCYMIELYNDGFVDLLKDKKAEEKQLTIRLDAKGVWRGLAAAVHLTGSRNRCGAELHNQGRWQR